MMSKLSTNQLIIGALSLLIVLFVELSFFQNGSTILLVLACVLLYLGIKKSNRPNIWGGIVCLFLACITLVTVRIFILFCLIYALYRFAYRQEETLDTAKSDLRGVVYTNRRIADFNNETETFKWEDILVERFIGQLVIDTTNTVLPTGKSLITIRQTFGSVRVIVPYEVNVQLHMTTLYGEVSYNNSTPKRLLNETFVMHDVNEALPRTLVIFVSGQLLDVEVVRG